MATEDPHRVIRLVLDRRQLHIATEADAIPAALRVIEDACFVLERFGHVRLSMQTSAALAVLKKRMAEC